MTNAHNIEGLRSGSALFKLLVSEDLKVKLTGKPPEDRFTGWFDAYRPKAELMLMALCAAVVNANERELSPATPAAPAPTPEPAKP